MVTDNNEVMEPNGYYLTAQTMFWISSAICLATIAVNTVIHFTTIAPATAKVTATTFTIINKVFSVHTLELHKSCQWPNKISIALSRSQLTAPQWLTIK